MNILFNYIVRSWTYGGVRAMVYGPQLEKDEYITDYLILMAMYALVAPLYLPYMIYTDVRNIEHWMRGMPGDINIYPW